MVSTIFIQPKISSIRFRSRWLTLQPSVQVVRPSRIQRRSWLALIPLPKAPPATDAPSSPQASIKDCLNSSEWVRGYGGAS
jgi:hypothetical protein